MRGVSAPDNTHGAKRSLIHYERHNGGNSRNRARIAALARRRRRRLWRAKWRDIVQEMMEAV